MVVIVGVGTSNGITEGVVKIGVVLVFVFIVAVGIVGLFISLSIINCFGSFECHMEPLNVLPRVPNTIGCRTHLRTFLEGSKEILFFAAINNSFFMADRCPVS
jgi:hypothetical protein